MNRVRADLWAIVGIATDTVYRIRRWRWACRLDDAIYGRHLAAQIERERSDA